VSPSAAVAPVPLIRSFSTRVFGGGPDGTVIVGSFESGPVFGVVIVGVVVVLVVVVLLAVVDVEVAVKLNVCDADGAAWMWAVSALFDEPQPAITPAARTVQMTKYRDRMTVRL